jgi:uncharacterized protein
MHDERRRARTVSGRSCLWPILERAEALHVPIYLHPAPPPKPVTDVYFSGLDEPVPRMISIAGWGWHAELGLHTLPLIVSGVLDRFPGCSS